MEFEEMDEMEPCAEEPATDSDREMMGMSVSALEAANTDLMPKIRFTTDLEEAEAAKDADRSDPMNLPDAVFYVGPKDGGGAEAATGVTETDEAAGVPKFTRDDGAGEEFAKIPKFQNDTFVDARSVAALAREEERRQAELGGDQGQYAGPSVESIELKLEEATKSLTYAQINLAEAIARGSGVLSAQRMVESAQKVVDALLRQHEEAVKFRGVE